VRSQVRMPQSLPCESPCTGQTGVRAAQSFPTTYIARLPGRCRPGERPPPLAPPPRAIPPSRRQRPRTTPAAWMRREARVPPLLALESPGAPAVPLPHRPPLAGAAWKVQLELRHITHGPSPLPGPSSLGLARNTKPGCWPSCRRHGLAVTGWQAGLPAPPKKGREEWRNEGHGPAPVVQVAPDRLQGGAGIEGAHGRRHPPPPLLGDRPQTRTVACGAAGPPLPRSCWRGLACLECSP
jgi:hypothetical protein